MAACAGCRTQLLDSTDTDAFVADAASAPKPDFALAPVDAAAPGSDAGTPCGLDEFCDRATEVCVYFERGDCGGIGCMKVPAQCLGASERTCECLGATICVTTRPGETLTCEPSMDENTIQCRSNILCI